MLFWNNQIIVMQIIYYPSSLNLVDSLQQFLVDHYILLQLTGVEVQPTRFEVQLGEQIGWVIVHLVSSHLKLETEKYIVGNNAK